MPKSPPRRTPEKTRTEPSVISLPNFEKHGAAALTPMNFRVAEAFHREFKLYAVQRGKSMVEVLHEAFHLLKTTHKAPK